MEKGIDPRPLYSLLDWFGDVEDPRIDRKKLYPLDEILLLTVCAVMSGLHEWDEIVDFGQIKLAWLKKYRPFENGIPSHDTLNRVIGLVNYQDFEVFFSIWASGFAGSLSGKLVNIDGKKLRGSVNKMEQQISKKEGGKSAIHLVEAWCSELNLCLGQVKTDTKSNEITAIPDLLDMLELSGSIVTIDAMGCQKTIASKIVEKEADYILALKRNHETLYDEVIKLFDNEVLTNESVQENKGHGRFETRVCRVISASRLPDSINWTGLKNFVEIYSERTIITSKEQTSEFRYYLTSLDMTAENLNQLIRQHWGIENKLHWAMDVQFQEDSSRKRQSNAAQNFAILRRCVLNLLKSFPEKISVNRKISKCAISDEYRKKILDF